MGGGGGKMGHWEGISASSERRVRPTTSKGRGAGVSSWFLGLSPHECNLKQKGSALDPVKGCRGLAV